MTQSSYNTYTVNDQSWKAYEESWETKKAYIQSYFDRRSVTHEYRQPNAQYHGDNMKYFGQSYLTHKDITGRKYLSYDYNGNKESIANGENLCVPRPRPAQPLAVPRSTSPRSRPSVPRFQPISTRSQLQSAITRPSSPTSQPPSPRSRSPPPTSRPPTPRPRPPSLRCRPPSQQTQTMHDPSAFTYHQFHTQFGNQMETHIYPCQRFYYQDGYWNHPEICHTDFYQLPPSRTSRVQSLIEREKNEANYSGHFPRETLINGTKQMSSEYSIQAQINERRQVSTLTYPPTEEHNQISVEYVQQDERKKNEPSAQLTFLPIEEISQTKYENDESSIMSRTGPLQGQSESRRVIRTGQYRKAPYSSKGIGTPTNIRLRSTGRTSETESNKYLPIYGSVSPLPSNVRMVQNQDTYVATNKISEDRSQEQSLERRGIMRIQNSGFVTPLLRAPYLEDGSAITVYPALSPDSDRMVVIQCSTLETTAGADMGLKYDCVLPGYQIPQQWTRPVIQSGHVVDRTPTTRWRKHSDLNYDVRLNCQETNKYYTCLPPTSKGDRYFINSTKEAFASNATEQYCDSENDICKTAVTGEIPTEITTPSEPTDAACNKSKERSPKHLQTEETLHLMKGTVADDNANNTAGITPKAVESKDGPQANPTIVELIDRLLKEARKACDLLQQQGQCQQENTRGKIRIEKIKGGRPNTSGLIDTCGYKSDINDNTTPFSRSSRRLHPGTGTGQKEIDIIKDVRLLMSDLNICGNKVAPAKEPASSGIWPPVKKDLDSDKEEEKSNIKTCIKEETKSCAIKAKRRLSSKELSLPMNTSHGCVDRFIRIVSSEDLLSTLSEHMESMKGGKRVSRQEEVENEGKEDWLVNSAKKTHAVFSELSENTKRAGSSLSQENITRAKISKPEEEVTMSALIKREKNIEPEEQSKKSKIDENETDIEPSSSCQPHEEPVSSDEVVESRKKRTNKEVDEHDVPTTSCFSQESVRSSVSKQESSNKSFISKDHDSTANCTEIIESDIETRKLASKDTIPEHEKRKTDDDVEDNDCKAKRSKLGGGIRRTALIQNEKNVKSKEKTKKRKVDENENEIKPAYSDQEHKEPTSSKDEDLDSPKKRKRTGLDENYVSKPSCFCQELETCLPEQESSNKSSISELNEINVNGTKKIESDDKTKNPVLKDFIPEHEESKTNDDEKDNKDSNLLSLLQEPEIPSSSNQGSGNKFGTLLHAGVNSADIGAITSIWTHANQSGPERVRKSKSMRKPRKRNTIVNELKPAKSDSLTELFKLLRI